MALSSSLGDAPTLASPRPTQCQVCDIPIPWTTYQACLASLLWRNQVSQHALHSACKVPQEVKDDASWYQLIHDVILQWCQPLLLACFLQQLVEAVSGNPLEHLQLLTSSGGVTGESQRLATLQPAPCSTERMVLHNKLRQVVIAAREVDDD